MWVSIVRRWKGISRGIHSVRRSSTESEFLRSLGISLAACGSLGREAQIETDWVNRAADIVHAYLASVSYIDSLLGTLIDAFPSDTNVILWSDHGYTLGRKLGFQKQQLNEEGSRVPLIIAGPAVSNRAGESCSNVVSLMDIYPTIMSMAHVTVSAPIDGRNLTPLFSADSPPNGFWQDEAITAFSYFEAPEARRYPKPGRNDVCLGEPGSAQYIDNPTAYDLPQGDRVARLRYCSYSIRNRNFRYTNYFQTGLYQSGTPSKLNNQELYYHGPVLEHRPAPDPGETTNLLDCAYVNPIAAFNRANRRNELKNRIRAITGLQTTEQLELASLGCLTGT
jgi:hypothetical protein